MIEKSVEQYQANIYLDLFSGGVFSWQDDKAITEIFANSPQWC